MLIRQAGDEDLRVVTSLRLRFRAGSNDLSLRRLLLYTTDDGRGLYEKAGFAPNPKWMELPQ